jgi:hypothetical protein
MKTEVYRVYCTAGTPITRTPESPTKFVTVYFPEDVLRKLSSPEAQVKAIHYAKTLLQEENVNDPQFKTGSGWFAKMEPVDLSDYATPNLEAPGGIKVWLN